MAITNKDVEKLTGVFATKGDLGRIEEKHDKFRDEVLSGLDKVMDELLKAREDRVFAVGKDREQDQKIGNLEQRMEKVEAKVGA